MKVTKNSQPPQIPHSSPYLAVIFHRSTGENKQTNVVGATKHEIVEGVIQSGKFASLPEVRAILQENTNQTDTASILPSNVLIDSVGTLAWYKKSFKAPMWFRIGSNSEVFDVTWCNLLFIVNKANSRLYVYAIGNGSRPDQKTKVYQAPLMNIYKNGLVCQGTARLPDDISVANIDEIEDTIIKSNFTHVNHSECLSVKATTSSLVKYWRNLSRSNARVKVKDLHFISSLDELLSSKENNFGE